ncbi:hypothetical protein Tco_0797797 [Tanacetum coccineum]
MRLIFVRMKQILFEKCLSGWEGLCICITSKNQGDVNEAMGHKKKAVMVTSDPLAVVVRKLKKKHKEKVASSIRQEGHFAKDCKKAKCDSGSMQLVFMAKMENVLSDLEESSSSAEETIAEVSYYTSDLKVI